MVDEKASAGMVSGPVMGVGVAAVAVALAVWALWGEGEGDKPAPQVTAAATENAAAENASTENSGAQTALAAAPQPTAEAQPAAEPQAPAEAQASTEAPPPAPPHFDVVRVDAAGLATIAGTAPVGARLSLRLDGAALADVAVDGAGQFATVLSLPAASVPQMLELVAVLADGSEIAAGEAVAIAPIMAPAAPAAPETLATTAESAGEAGGETQAAQTDAPAALLVSDAGAVVLQDAAPAGAEGALPVAIEAISYGDGGTVMLAGQAAAGAILRLYLDDAAQGEVQADGRGHWTAQFAAVTDGEHVLRADEIDAGGAVVNRFETPFSRSAPETVAAETETATGAASATAPTPVTAPAPVTVTIVPGMTLWAIARENFGDGVLYVQVFEANRDKIKDPDLIYPGQVFTLPQP